MGKASLLTDEFKKGMKYPIELRDKNGNQIYQEYINGFWYKREYDSNGNMIYCENSNGYWSKSEYDSNNDEIYYENSDGKMEDKRPKKELTIKEIEEMLGIKNIQIVKG